MSGGKNVAPGGLEKKVCIWGVDGEKWYVESGRKKLVSGRCRAKGGHHGGGGYEEKDGTWG